MSERENRNSEYQPDRTAERFLLELNSSLAPLTEKKLIPENSTEAPLSFICFVPRAGSTLLSQLLARSGKFSYISNFVARFWESPEVGMYLQELTGLENFKACGSDNLTSVFGVTEHPLDPHEFGFFWRRFIPAGRNDYVEPPYDERVICDLRASISKLRKQSSKPLFFKNSIAGYNYEFIKHCFPDAKFIILTRDRADVVRSIMKGRKMIFGDEEAWLSLKPRSYSAIVAKSKTGLEQVERQFDDIERTLNNLRSEFIEDTLVIDYPTVVDSPDLVVEDIYRFVTGDLCGNHTDR